MNLTKFDLTNEKNCLHNLMKFFFSLETNCIVTYNKVAYWFYLS
jgi:hypothetical protein